ncbi:MAG TPA: NAD-dependent epimerase/dehydratase family protein [Gaiellaceae bacterium]|nr:NAD-dependent epimerase/dehydratase family protein [Gaiellaceae bacterium]
MRAVVTGGAGFIGSHLVDALLARGDEVWVLDNLSTGRRERVADGARLIEGDIRDAEAVGAAFAEAEPDACFHLAAQADVRRSVEDPAYDADVNVLGTIRTLEAARRHAAQVVFSSTGGAIYGECDAPAPETAARQPISPYGTSKLAGEEYLAMERRLYGASHVALRYGNVYGPRQDPHGEAGVVAIFLGRLAAGEEFTIFGDGTQTRDYVYVGDVVRATLAAVGSPGGVFNVGTGRETSVLELADACRAASGVDREPAFADARLGELQRSVLSTALAERELGFRAEVEPTDGIARTWDSIRGEGTP